MRFRIGLTIFLLAGLVSSFVLFLFATGILTRVSTFTIIISDSSDINLPPKTLVVSSPTSSKLGTGFTDIPPQSPLANPPEIIKAIYATSWSAGSKTKMDYLIDLIAKTELNAIVIDVKDFSGFITYDTTLPQVLEYGAREIRIGKINSLVKRLHDEGIYVIGRVSVFQDERLATARPDLAAVSSTTQTIWHDRKGLPWIDPNSKDAWDYNIAIAKDALARGFDEINFDYIRFASDGNLKDIVYPHWDGKTFHATVIHNFWKYVREQIPDRPISADLFGLTTVNYDDLGIGQKLENAIPYFDAIAPMVYPSHYYPGSFGLQKPALYPYEVVKKSMDVAVTRLIEKSRQVTGNFSTTTPVIPISTFRPWLQDFNLGADYTAEMVRAQIQATYDATADYPGTLSGWMLWNPSNNYTKGALLGPEAEE
ncbi:MAG: putative glycoside hydrolase [Patescibacteria group bacterium]